MNDVTWPPEWIRATLAQSVLAIVATERTTYGYLIRQRLQAEGFDKIKGGTLYPILARLEAEGWIISSWGEGDGGPGRKFVAITDAGREEVARIASEWGDFAPTIAKLWNNAKDVTDE